MLKNENQAKLAPDHSAIRKHLDALAVPYLGSDYSDGLLEIAYTAPNKPAPDRAKMFELGDLDAAASFAAERNAEGCNIYVGAALRYPDAARDRRGSTLDFYAAAFAPFEADEDAAGVAARGLESGLEATIEVVTGQTPEQRVHHWLPLRELCDDPEELADALEATVAHVGADPKVKDAARIMRLGGTVNWINDPSKQSKGYISEITTVKVITGTPADLIRLSGLPPLSGCNPGAPGRGSGDGGPSDIVRNADGKVTDGREAHWCQIVIAEIAKYQRSHGDDPLVDDLFTKAFSRFREETIGDDRWTSPRGQKELRKRVQNTLRRLRQGQLARFGLSSIDTGVNREQAEQVQARWQADRAGTGANIAPPVRSFDDLMAAAKALEPGQIEEIEAIVRDCVPLEPARQDTVLQEIKKASGMAIKTLRDQLKADTNAGSSPDHLGLARMALAEIGRQSIICAEASVWIWQERGVWVQQQDRAVKQVVQNRLDPEPQVHVTSNLVNSVTDVLKSEIYKPDHQFNRGNPETVNCLNGELELSDGRWQLKEHNREHYRTTQIPVEYDALADAPLFETFLGQVFRDDPDHADKIQSLLELMGYTLMSHARHERFIMLIGSGANGKSVLLSVLEGLLGYDNVAGVQPSNFDNRFQRAHLHQKLANIVTELKQGEVIADAELKAITSGEPATVEHKHKDPFVMRPFSTCWFGTNHMPHTRDFSDALFRRATILQFNRTFSEEEQDPLLKEKLLTELPGILNFALRAYGRALTDGFTHPPSSEAAKQEWRLEADQVALFVDEVCERVEAAKTPVGEVFSHYQTWASQNGIHKSMSKKGFRDRLTRLGFGSYRYLSTRYVTGLRLVSGAGL